METFAPILAVFGCFAVIVGLVMLLPFVALKPHRSKAKYTLLGGFGAFVIGAIFLPDDPDVKIPVAPKAISSLPAKPVSKPIVPNSLGSNAKRDALAFAKEITDASVLCDVQALTVARNMRRNDSVDVYTSSKKAEEYCSLEAQQIQEMKVPSGIGDKADSQFHGALYRCSQELDQKASAFGKVAVAVDQGASISEQAAIQEQLREVASIQNQCREDIENAAVSAGADKRAIGKVMKEG